MHRDDPTVRRAALLVVIGIATVVGRLHELVAPLRFIRPIYLVVGLLALATFAARKRLAVTRPMLSDPSLLILYAYWGWMAMTIPTSLYKAHSVVFIFNIAIIFVFATMVSAQPPTWPHLRTITRGFFVTTAVFALLLVVRGYPVMDEGGIRYAITASLDPNDCAGFLAIGAPMALAEARRRGSGTWRLMSLGMFGMICLGIVRTGSRGGFLALVAGVIFVFLADNGVRVLVTVCVLGVVGLVGQKLAPSLLPARVAAMSNLENDYNLTLYGGRVQIWTRGVKYFKENPVFGVGVDNFPVREGQQMQEDNQPGHWSAPHSAYVQAFVELGLIGGLIFCTAIGYSIKRVAPVFRRISPVSGMKHPEYCAAVVAFSVSAVFLSHAYFWGFFALVALCALAHRTLVRT